MKKNIYIILSLLMKLIMYIPNLLGIGWGLMVFYTAIQPFFIFNSTIGIVSIVFTHSLYCLIWYVGSLLIKGVSVMWKSLFEGGQYLLDKSFKMGRFEEHSYENQNYNDYHKQQNRNDNYQEEQIQEPIEEPVNPRLEKLMTMAKRGTTNEQTIAKKKILNMLEKEGYIEK